MYYMKYFIKKLNLPLEIQDKIYSFINYTDTIKNLNKIWYKRLITNDYHYCKLVKLHLKREEHQLKILLNQNAFKIIDNIHKYNNKLI